MGLAVDRTLLYFTAGLAFAEVANNVQYNSSKFPTFNMLSYNVDFTRFGWVVGSGLEYAVTATWTVKGEAIYAQLNTVTASWISPGLPGLSSQCRLQYSLQHFGRRYSRWPELQIRLV